MPCKIDKQDGNNFCHNTGFWQNRVCPEDKEKCGYWVDDQFDVGLNFLKEPTEDEKYACLPFGGDVPGGNNGQGKYEQLGAEIGKMVDEKQAAYGDSFGKAPEILRIYYPDGVKPEQYEDFLAIVRDIDKSMRIATDKDAFGESPWRDKAGYALLSVGRERGE